MGLLDGKVALVTGAGRGIGMAIVEAFAREGADVAAAARTESEIEQLCSTLRADGYKAAAILMDVTREESIRNGVDKTRRKFGHIDILVNNAGVIALRSIIDTPTDIWDELMSTNVRGVFLLCREVLPEMIERGSGRVINVGSAAGRRGYKEQGAYCTSKHALAGFTKVLAAETQQYGIRVHMLSPGGVLTGLSSELRASRGEAEDSPEWMTSKEVAAAALYLCTQTGAAFTDELMLRRYAAEPWR